MTGGVTVDRVQGREEGGGAEGGSTSAFLFRVLADTGGGRGREVGVDGEVGARRRTPRGSTGRAPAEEEGEREDPEEEGGGGTDVAPISLSIMSGRSRTGSMVNPTHSN